MMLLGQTLDFDAAPWFGLWLLWPALAGLSIWIGRRDRRRHPDG